MSRSNENPHSAADGASSKVGGSSSKTGTDSDTASTDSGNMTSHLYLMQLGRIRSRVAQLPKSMSKHSTADQINDIVHSNETHDTQRTLITGYQKKGMNNWHKVKTEKERLAIQISKWEKYLTGLAQSDPHSEFYETERSIYEKAKRDNDETIGIESIFAKLAQMEETEIQNLEGINVALTRLQYQTGNRSPRKLAEVVDSPPSETEPGYDWHFEKNPPRFTTQDATNCRHGDSLDSSRSQFGNRQIAQGFPSQSATPSQTPSRFAQQLEVINRGPLAPLTDNSRSYERSSFNRRTRLAPFPLGMAPNESSIPMYAVRTMPQPVHDFPSRTYNGDVANVTTCFANQYQVTSCVAPSQYVTADLLSNNQRAGFVDHQASHPEPNTVFPPFAQVDCGPFWGSTTSSASSFVSLPDYSRINHNVQSNSFQPQSFPFQTIHGHEFVPSRAQPPTQVPVNHGMNSQIDCVQGQPQTSSASRHDVGQQQVGNNFKFSVPNLKLGIFDGTDETDFVSFWDIFLAVVEQNPDIRPVYKFSILYYHLAKDPKKLIASLPITDGNYPIALHLLLSRYGNRNRIRQKIQRELSLIRPSTLDLDSLNHTYTSVQASVLKLISSNQNTNHFSITNCILTKFPTEILSQAALTKYVDEEWSTQSLMTALSDVIRRREEIQDLAEESHIQKRFFASHEARRERENGRRRLGSLDRSHFLRPLAPNRNQRAIQSNVSSEERNRQVVDQDNYDVQEYPSSMFAVSTELTHSKPETAKIPLPDKGRLEKKEQNAQTNHSVPNEQNRQRTGPSNKTHVNHCIYCTGNHRTHFCQKYATTKARMAVLIQERRCLICLEKGHFSSTCSVRGKRVCGYCNGRDHHLSLCFKKENSTQRRKAQDQQRARTDEPTENVLCALSDGQNELDLQSGSDDYDEADTSNQTTGKCYSEYQYSEGADDDDSEDAAQSDCSEIVATINTKAAKDSPKPRLYTTTVRISSTLMPEKTLICYALLDSGAGRSWVSPALVEQLNLPLEDNGTMTVIPFQTSEKKSTDCLIRDIRTTIAVHLSDKTSLTVDASVSPVSQMVGRILLQPLDKVDRAFIVTHNLSKALAAQSFDRKTTCVPDIIFGQNVYTTLMYGDDDIGLELDIIKPSSLPSGLSLIPSLLGYFIGGVTHSQKGHRSLSISTILPPLDDDVDIDMTECLDTATVNNEFTDSQLMIYTQGEKNKPKEDKLVLSITKKHHSVEASIGEKLKQFQSLELLGISDNASDNDDDIAAKHFEETVRFTMDTVTLDPRIEVTFPPRPGAPRLPSNMKLAYARFKASVRRLHENPALLARYHGGFQELLDRGIIEKAPEESELDPSWEVHYLAHHPVFREDHATSKMRTVFDCGAKASEDEPALNEAFLRGAPLIADLGKSLIRSRRYRYLILADIEKAFLMLLIVLCNRNLTRFFWFDSLESKKIVCYWFRRLLFGLISAPHLLAFAILWLIDTKGAIWALFTRLHFYVDNLITGTDNLEDALALHKELMALFMDYASMYLREWNSNCPGFMEQIRECDRMKDKNPKVLGIRWDVNKDTFQLCSPSEKTVDEPWTKRLMLSQLNSCFDPLGFATPLTLGAKLFLQKIVLLNYDWDTPIESALSQEWATLVTGLQEIGLLTIPRYFTDNISECEVSIHGFADASAVSYAAVVYLRLEHSTSKRVSVNFIVSKCRLTPNGRKPLTVVRLELLSLLILTRLINYTRSALDIPDARAFTWTDSQAVLHWLRSKKTLATFVRNRVKEILACTNTVFNFIRTGQNIADMATRPGVNYEQLQASDWLGGPAFLRLPESDWPNEQLTPVPKTEQLQFQKEFQKAEVRQLDIEVPDIMMALNENTENQVGTWITSIAQFSNLTRLLRSTVYVLRFLNVQLWSKLSPKWTDRFVQFANIMRPIARHTGAVMSSKELRAAHDFLLSRCQHDEMPDVLEAINQGKPNSLVHQMGLYLDRRGVVRGQSRMTRNAELPPATKYPKLLPKTGLFTKLVIKHLHEKLMHASAQYILAQVNEIYWLPAARSTINAVIVRCTTCKRLRGPPYKMPVMSDLPSSRTDRSLLFQHVGLDLFGPTLVLTSCECKRTVKVWVILYTCFSTRNVYLDVLNDLSTTEMILGLKRFISRFGQPKTILSDNGPAFVSSKELWESMSQHMVGIDGPETLSDYCSNSGITWQLIVPYFAASGGVYERLVGIVKRSLKAAKGRRVMELTLFRTTLSECEAIVNSRPITTVSSNVDEVSTLRPVDLWFPQSFQGNARLDTEAILDEYLPTMSTKDKLLRFYAKSQDVTDKFWKMFRNLYLPQLRDRKLTGHNQPARTSLSVPKVGSIVHIHQELVPRGVWKYGKITRLIQSKDGEVRAAELKSSSGSTIRRPLQKLYPLECDDDSTQTPSHRAKKVSFNMTANQLLLILMVVASLLPVVQGEIPTHSDGHSAESYVLSLIYSLIGASILLCITLWSLFVSSPVENRDIGTATETSQTARQKIQSLNDVTECFAKVITLHPNAKGLYQGSPHSSGYDLFARQSVDVMPKSWATVNTGIRVQTKMTIMIAPRSGLGEKGLLPMSGIVDPDYTGEIKVLIFNHAAYSQRISCGMRFAQVLFFDTIHPQFDDPIMRNTRIRGPAGFGSSGQFSMQPVSRPITVPIIKSSALIVIMGGISSGKSSVMSAIERSFKNVTCRQEPVSEWCRFGSKHTNLLKLQYNNPRMHTWKLSLLSMKSIVNNTTAPTVNDILLCERDLVSSKIFLDAFRPEISDLAYELLDDHCSFLQAHCARKPDVYIRITAPVNTMRERISTRGREAESNVSTEFLERLENSINAATQTLKTPLITWDNSETDLRPDNYWASKFSSVCTALNLPTPCSSHFTSSDIETPRVNKQRRSVTPLPNRKAHSIARSRSMNSLRLALYTALLLSWFVIGATSSSKCPAVGQLDTGDKLLPIQGQICERKGIYIYKFLLSGKYCWDEIVCRDQKTNKDTGCITRTGECSHFISDCKCPPGYEQCSHATGVNEPSNEHRELLENLKPSYCSLEPSLSCNPNPSYGSWFEVLTYGDSSTGQRNYLVASLNLVNDEIVKNQYTCVGSGSEVSGSPGYCDSHDCVQQYTHKLCYYQKSPRVFLETQAGRVQIRAWKTVQIKYYNHKDISDSVQEWDDSQASLSCQGPGVAIKITKTVSMISLCSNGYCYSVSEPIPPVFTFPPDITAQDHDVVMKVWSKGQLVKHSGVRCKGTPFCDLITCTFCLKFLSNPTCAGTIYILVFAVAAYLLSFAGFWALKSLQVFAYLGIISAKAIKAILKFWYFIVIALKRKYESGKQHSDSASCDTAMDTQRRKGSREPLVKSAALLVLIMISVPLVSSCGDLVLLSAKSRECAVDKNGTSTCKVSSSSRLNLLPQNQDACLLLSSDLGEPEATLKITVEEMSLMCDKRHLYYTRDVSFDTSSMKRCPSMGSCNHEHCTSVTKDTDVAELPANAKNAPGYTFCTGSDTGWFSSGSGCFSSAFSCLYYRWWGRSISSHIYEVYDCTSYSLSLKINIRYMTDTKQKSHNFRLTAGRTYTWNKFKFTIISSLQKKVSLLSNSKFIRREDSRTIVTVASDAGSPIANKIGSIQCQSHHDAARLARDECFLSKDICSCVPVGSAANCKCNEHDIRPLFSNKQNQLPLRSSGYTIEVGGTGSIQASFDQFATTELQLDMTDLEVSSKVYKNRCGIVVHELKGCYSCLSGAQLEFSCRTDFGEAIAFVECKKSIKFVTSCNTKNEKQSVVLALTEAAIDTTCTVICPAGGSPFTIKGQLYFVPVIRVSNLIHSDNEEGLAPGGLNLPDLDFGFLGRLFASHWLVTLAVVIVLVLIVWLTFPLIIPCMAYAPKFFKSLGTPLLQVRDKIFTGVNYNRFRFWRQQTSKKIKSKIPNIFNFGKALKSKYRNPTKSV